MSGRRKSGGGGPGRKNNNKGKKGKKQQTPTGAGRGRGGNNSQRPRRSSLPNERTRNLDGASPTGRSFMREDAYFRMKFLEEQELLANMMRVNQRKRQKESPSRRPFKQRQQSDSESDSTDSGSIDSDVVADYAMNISSDEDLGTIHDSLKGLTADQNFNVLRQFDEEIIGGEDDSDESDEENQIKSQVGRFNLSKKVRKRSEKKTKKRQNLVHAVVNKQNNRFIAPADFEDERPSLDAYLGTNREYYAQEDYYQVPEAVLSNADKLRNKYLKLIANTSFVRAKDPASFLEPAKDPSITSVTLTTTTTTTSTVAPVNTDTIIQKVESFSISKNNNEEVKTETVRIVEEKKEKPDVNMDEFKDNAPMLNEKLPEYRYEQVTEIKIVTSTTPSNSNNNTPKQPVKKGKSPNKKITKKDAEPVEDIEFEWVGEESDSEDDEDDIVIDEDIEEDDEEDEEDDLSDVDIADMINEDEDDEEDDEEDEEDSEEDMPVQYVFDRNSGLSKKEQSLMLYWAQEDELKRQARRRNRRPAGSESEDSELSEEDLLDMQDIDDDESSEDEQFARILNSNYSPKDQRQFTPSPKGRRMPRDVVGFPDDEEKPSHGRSEEKPMSAKQRKLLRSNQTGVKTSKKKLKKLNKLYKKGNRKRRLTRNDIEYWSQIMVEFIKDQSMETKSVSNMNKFQLMQLAKLAKFYNLKASMAGSGKRRYAVVTKTDHSRLRSEEDLKKFLNRFFPEEEEITRRNGDSRYGSSGSKTKVNTRKDMHTRVLVGNSQPIPESNVGHIMLMRMGWIGGGLGSQKQGIEEPIQPVIRPRGRGLGFNANSL